MESETQKWSFAISESVETVEVEAIKITKEDRGSVRGEKPSILEFDERTSPLKTTIRSYVLEFQFAKET